jgi:DNA-binding transcriptional LysR family regulator
MVSVAYQPVFRSNNWLTLRTMAADGVGIAALPAHVCQSWHPASWSACCRSGDPITQH